MSRTFFWRELRRQAPAALGMLALSWILLLGTTAFTRGHHLGAVAGFCFLLVPVLLGVYAFGPDLELGQERFLSVLPVSRGGLGALRLGTAAALTLAVDGMVFASFFALGALKTESWTEPASALWASMLLLPLGALAAVTVRHTLGALGATLCTLAVGPTVLDLLEEFHVRFDEVLVGALLVGWGAAALWLYGRARSTPPLKVAIPLGAAALLVGFLPAPAYGAFRYLTQDDPDAWRLSSTLLPAPAGRAFAVSRPDARVGFKSAVGVWYPGREVPRFVGLGSATWLGDWLVVSDAYAQGTLEVFELSAEALRRHDVRLVDVSAAPATKQAVARASGVLDQDRQDVQGLLVDRVEDEL
ncbi:MAG: hypothetical protein KDD82_14700, partial [Planctomycetes bacterium]|nr:hypothetical protein [Planctomycetota bacterium]